MIALLGDDPVSTAIAGALDARPIDATALKTLGAPAHVLVPFAYFRNQEAKLKSVVRSRTDLSFVVLSGDPAALSFARSNGLLFASLPTTRETIAMLCAGQELPRRILVADDSALARKTLTRPLREAGYDVVEVEDGAQAIQALTTTPFDMVVTDIEMPHATGYDVCRAVRSNRATAALPVIIQSSLGESKDIERGFDVGANEYIVKPVNADEFLSRLANIFAGLSMRGREKILTVDDSQIVRGLLSQGLSQQGFAVEVACDGREGLTRAAEIAPNLIISDFDMPEMTGFEMVAALRKDERTRAIPVVMLTARDSALDRAKTTAAGARAYVTKPFNVNDVVAVVERIFAEVRLEREREAMTKYLSDGARRAAKHHAKAGTDVLFGEEKVISVLFSDIKGFTTRSANMEPAAVVAMLNDYFDVMTAVLAAEDAIIDKFIGDAIMALFEGDDGAVRACRGALAMQAAHAKVNAGRGADPIITRIGINSGKVIVGEIGSRTVRREYTAIGDTVNRAQRHESNAPPGGVLISDTTYACVKDLAVVEPIELRLKGIDAPVTAYKLMALNEGTVP